MALLGAAAGLTPGDAGSSWGEMRPPIEPRRTGTLEHRTLDESSGVAVSRRHPGILWTLNDSGNPPWIFATDTLGRHHGRFVVKGAENEDWEAIALGPCGSRDCLYIADTGDNGQRRDEVRLYRLPEPPLPTRARITRTAEALTVRYPGGARDVEAAFVSRDGTVHLISKGWNRGVRVFRVPPGGWKRGKTILAQDGGELPIEAGGLGALVTDAALSPSGDRVAIRTYLGIHLFALTPRGTLRPLGAACNAAGLQLLGEGIAWLDDRELVLTSEGGLGTRGSIVVLGCDGHTS
jgi:hypothetical protein